MVFVFEVIDRETPGDRLLVQRVGKPRRVQLVRLILTFGPDHALDLAEGEQVAEFGPIEHVRRGDHRFVTRLEVAVETDGDRDRLFPECELAAGDPGREHLVEHSQGYAGLVAELADPAAAGVEPGIVPGVGQERVVAAVPAAHPLAELAVGGGAAVRFDPGVFVGRDGLRGELAADPVRLFGEDHPFAELAGGEGAGHAADPGADDEDACLRFASRHACPLAGSVCRDVPIVAILAFRSNGCHRGGADYQARGWSVRAAGHHVVSRPYGLSRGRTLRWEKVCVSACKNAKSPKSPERRGIFPRRRFRKNPHEAWFLRRDLCSTAH